MAMRACLGFLATLSLVACSAGGGDKAGDREAEAAPSVPSNVEVVPSDPALGVDPCWGRTPTLIGTPGDDRIEATPEADTIVTLGGNDHVSGMRRQDRLCAGDGDDVVEDVIGAGPLVMGEGDDVVRADDVSEVRLGAGDDRFSAADDFFVVDPGLGNDVLVALPPAQSETGSLPCVDLRSAPLPLQVDLTAGTARGEGTDRIRNFHCVLTGEHGDVVLGTPERDRIYLGEGTDLARAGDGDDFIAGELGNDRVFAGAGDDLVHGDEGADLVDGGPGNDELVGSSGADHLEGGPGRDVVLAVMSCNAAARTGGDLSDDEPDMVFGGAGSDYTAGDVREDRINGGPGYDVGHGASVEDQFGPCVTESPLDP